MVPLKQVRLISERQPPNLVTERGYKVIRTALGTEARVPKDR